MSPETQKPKKISKTAKIVFGVGAATTVATGLQVKHDLDAGHYKRPEAKVGNPLTWAATPIANALGNFKDLPPKDISKDINLNPEVPAQVRNIQLPGDTVPTPSDPSRTFDTLPPTTVPIPPQELVPGRTTLPPSPHEIIEPRNPRD